MARLYVLCGFADRLYILCSAAKLSSLRRYGTFRCLHDCRGTIIFGIMAKTADLGFVQKNDFPYALRFSLHEFLWDAAVLPD